MSGGTAEVTNPDIDKLQEYLDLGYTKEQALELIKQILKKNPENQQAQQGLKQLQNVSL